MVENIVRQISEYLASFGEKPEIVTAISTLLLFISTMLLVIVTYYLGKITREEGIYNRKKSTTDAWSKIRATGPLPDVNGMSEADIFRLGRSKRALLRQLEIFAAQVNGGVFDLKTFNRVSGGWFLQNYYRIYPYIELRRKTAKRYRPYDEIVELNRRLEKIRKSRLRSL